MLTSAGAEGTGKKVADRTADELENFAERMEAEAPVMASS